MPIRLQTSRSILIDKSQLLDAIADDDDNKRKTDPFEKHPDSENPVMPDEIIAMIKFSGYNQIHGFLQVRIQVRSRRQVRRVHLSIGK